MNLNLGEYISSGQALLAPVVLADMNHLIIDVSVLSIDVGTSISPVVLPSPYSTVTSILPIFPDLKSNKLKFICSVIKNTFK